MKALERLARECSGVAEPLQSSDIQTVSNLFRLSVSQRRQWYMAKLGQCQKHLRETASAAGIATRLLAGTILNELADIGDDDVRQDRAVALATSLVSLVLGNRVVLGGRFRTASLGIAQIQVETAITHSLLPLVGRDFLPAPGVDLPLSRQGAMARKLLVRPCAIVACAAELRLQIRRLLTIPPGPWALQFDIHGDWRSQDASVGLQMDVAELVVAAYNSPDIVIAKNPGIRFGDDTTDYSPGIYSNARIHGANARQVMYDLNLLGLFA